MQSYEVEIKSLLGSAQNADALRTRMKEVDPSCALAGTNKQRNHYFQGGDLSTLTSTVKLLLDNDAYTKLIDFASKAKECSVRTRDKDGTVLLVVKASIDDTTSSNGIARMEFEEPVSATLEEIDQAVLSAGFAYQAKWSRVREEYVCQDINVTLDKNAGYGWLAEFEKIVHSADLVSSARAHIVSLMNSLGITELPQDRLARMFDYYNTHWPQYYGTENVFTIE